MPASPRSLLDGHTSAVEGSIGAIPRRLVVATEDEARARQVLKEAGRRCLIGRLDMRIRYAHISADNGLPAPA